MTPNYKTRDAVLGLRATCTPGSLMESTCDLALAGIALRELSAEQVEYLIGHAVESEDTASDWSCLTWNDEIDAHRKLVKALEALR